MYAIYGNIYHQYTPVMLAYIPVPWILWDLTCWQNSQITELKKSQPLRAEDLRGFLP